MDEVGDASSVASTATRISEPKYLTAPELAAVFRVTERSIRNWTREGRIPSIRLGGVYRYDPDEVARALTSQEPIHKQAPEPEKPKGRKKFLL